MHSTDDLNHLQLGQATTYPTTFDPSLLLAVPRALNRDPIGIAANQLPFHGTDYWNAYELSWLNSNGLPQVAVAEFSVPVTSPNLIESKSFKLYLNSLNEQRWQNWQQVEQQLVKDLSACAGAPVSVQVHALQNNQAPQFGLLQGHCIDDQDISIDCYDYNPDLLQLNPQAAVVREQLFSHLLKSNCLITNQPDWGSVYINYEGPQLNTESLLRYLVSFRRHNEFHEQCVERIFMDLRRVGISKLTVYARYTRRGGLDINPFRSNFEQPPAQQRLIRQ